VSRPLHVASVAHLGAVPAGVQPALEHAMRVRASIAATAHARLRKGKHTPDNKGSMSAISYGGIQRWRHRFDTKLCVQFAQLQPRKQHRMPPSHLPKVWAGSAAVAVAPGVPPLGLFTLHK
jgi:hypothetical protein